MTTITRTTQQDGTILVQFDGVLHNPHGPAVIKANGTREWVKNGLLHSWYGQPSQIFANGTKRWHIEGRLTSQHRLNAEGKGSLLTSYHTNGHRASEYFENLGVRLDYSFENGLLINKSYSNGLSFSIFEGKLMSFSNIKTGVEYKLPAPLRFSKVEAKLTEMINKYGMKQTAQYINRVHERYVEKRTFQNALHVMSLAMLTSIFH